MKRKFEQKKIPLYNKLNIFIEALNKNNGIYKFDILSEETIDLYKEEKNFSLFIYLFLKIYEKDNILCSRLISTFNKINEEEIISNDKDLVLGLYTFNKIYSKANSIIEENKYESISFYEIIVCYLCSYDKNNISKIINDCSAQNSTLLYEILIIYYSHFENHLYQDNEFYNNFEKYIINKGKQFEVLNRILNFINNIKTFLYVINENKVDIFKKFEYSKKSSIELPSNLKLIKKEYKEENQKKLLTELDNIIRIIEELIKFSKDYSFLAIYLKPSFWKYIPKQYNKPNLAYIVNYYNLRALLKIYQDLINVFYKNGSNKIELMIKEESIRYIEKDKYTFALNYNIKELFEIKKDKYNDEEKFGIIKKYIQYYNNDDKEDELKYQQLRSTAIFDSISFTNPSGEFRLTFHKLNFKELFKVNIDKFIDKITSKITNIATFGTIIEIIDTLPIDTNKKYYYYRILKDKFEYIIQNSIESLKEGNNLSKVIGIISNYITKIFLDENNTYFIEEQIIKLDDKLRTLIYFNLIKICNGEKYKKLIDYIFDIFLNNIKEIDKIIEIIKILKIKDKDKFLKKLMKICEFDKDEYYSSYENYKIKLLCKLNAQENQLINKNNCGNLQIILDNIFNDLEENLITKKQLEEFLNFEKIKLKKAEYEEEENYKNVIIQKLALIKIILPEFDPIEKYYKYKKNLTYINGKIKELIHFKNSLITFHNIKFSKQIKNITNIINNIEANIIKEFYSYKTQEDLKNIEKLKPQLNEIEKVKDFILFKIIYGNAKGKDQEERFNDALNRLKIIKKSFEKEKI